MVNNKKTKIFEFKTIIIFLIIIFLFLLDILTKYYFEGKKYLEGNFFFINSTINTGSAFNLFSNIYLYNFFVGIIGIISIILLIYYRKNIFNNNTENNIIIFIWIFVISGIAGNTFDRLVFGYTRDFIGFGEFFVFNIADFYLTIAVLIYIYYELRTKR